MKKIKNISAEHLDKEGNNVAEFMFTYSPEEQEEHKINKANAQAVFSPKFIPFYPSVAEEYQLSLTESIIYGFIEFYMSTGKTKRFYFNNQQLADVIGVSLSAVEKAIPKLKKVGLIDTSRKMKSGGGQIRFIKNVKSNEISKLHNMKDYPAKYEVSYIKENKINKNKTISNDIEQSYGNEEINNLLIVFKQVMGFPSSGKKDRWLAKHLLNNFSSDQLKAMMIFCATNEYAPRVGSLEKLWYKRGDVVAGIKLLQLKQSKKTIFIS